MNEWWPKNDARVKRNQVQHLFHVWFVHSQMWWQSMDSRIRWQTCRTARKPHSALDESKLCVNYVHAISVAVAAAIQTTSSATLIFYLFIFFFLCYCDSTAQMFDAYSIYTYTGTLCDLKTWKRTLLHIFIHKCCLALLCWRASSHARPLHFIRVNLRNRE